MRNKTILLLIMIIICGAALAVLTACDPTTVTHNLAYSSSAGGTVTGITSQTVADGKSGTAVTAEPSEGFGFVQWSDGYTDPTRQDTQVGADISVTALFAPLSFTLTYSAGAGGSIAGEATQLPQYGENGSPVTGSPTKALLSSHGRTAAPTPTARTSISARTKLLRQISVPRFI